MDSFVQPGTPGHYGRWCAPLSFTDFGRGSGSVSDDRNLLLSVPPGKPAPIQLDEGEPVESDCTECRLPECDDKHLLCTVRILAASETKVKRAYHAVLRARVAA